MSLEFPCPRCQHLLRTADDKAGLSATCPACGESIWVPYPHELAAAGNQPPPAPEPEAELDRYELEQDDPFADETSARSPSAATDNPYAIGATESPEDETGSDPFEPSPAEMPGADHRETVRTCERCATENDPDALRCRACGAELSPRQPAAYDDGWQPRDPDIGEIMQSSWGIYTGEMGLLIGGWLLMGVMGFGAGICCLIPMGIVMAIFVAIGGDMVWVGVVLGILLTLPLLIVATAILRIGYVYFCINIARGTSGGIGDLFYGIGEGRALIPGGLVVTLMVGLATLCTCGVASLVVWPLWYTQVFRRPTAGEVVGLGIEIIRQEFVTVLVVGLIFAGIYLAASFLPYIGFIVLIFAMPFLEMLYTVGYLRMERERIVVDRGR